MGPDYLLGEDWEQLEPLVVKTKAHIPCSLVQELLLGVVPLWESWWMSHGLGVEGYKIRSQEHPELWIHSVSQQVLRWWSLGCLWPFWMLHVIRAETQLKLTWKEDWHACLRRMEMGGLASGKVWFSCSYIAKDPSMMLCMCTKSLQSCPTLCDPTDCSLPDSSVHGFSRQEYWSELPCPPPGALPIPGIEASSPALQADSLPLSHWGSPQWCWLHLNAGSSHGPRWSAVLLGIQPWDLLSHRNRKVNCKSLFLEP